MANALSEFEKFKIKLGVTYDQVTKQCWFFHRWGRWQTVRSGDITNIAQKVKVGEFFRQARHCQRCNKLEMCDVEIR